MKRFSFPGSSRVISLWLVFLSLGLSGLVDRSRAQAAAPIVEVQRRDAVVQVVEATAPAVVSVTTEQVVRSSPFGSSRAFFDQFYQGLEPRERLQRASLGSGVIIDNKGHVLTNEHVIRGAARVTVGLSDDREIECEVIGSDPENDLAVLKMVKPITVTAAKIGTSRDLLIGETVIAIGNPFGLSQTVTTGVVSAKNRSFKVEDRIYRNFIQTDAAINPGNSGGPLLNIKGELIGINTAIYGNAQGLGFAIPIDKARKVVQDLIQYGQRLPAWVGMDIEEAANPSARGRAGRDMPTSVLVSWVQRGGPAEKAGVRVGDRLVTIDRSRVEGIEDFQSAIRQMAAGDELAMTLEREGGKQPEEFRVRSTSFPMEVVDQLIATRLGMEVAALNAGLARQYQLSTTEGLLITQVRRGGVLEKIGARPGDVIRKVNGVVTNQVEDLKSALIRNWGRKSFLCLIQRGRTIYTVPIPL